jgi:hypothetical protein
MREARPKRHSRTRRTRPLSQHGHQTVTDERASSAAQ